MTSVRGPLFACLLALVTASLAGGASAGPRPRVKNVTGVIEALAMDGSLVAYASEDTDSGCHKVVAWNVATGMATRVSGPARGPCFSDHPHGQRVVGLAVAGTRLAWVRNITGNTEADDYLYAASLPNPRERRLAAVRRVGEPPSQGGAISGVVGDGDLLAASLTEAGQTGATTTLRTVARAGLKTVAASPGALAAHSADLGRVAVVGENGIGIYSAAGRLLVTVPAPSVREVALRKDYLVALTATATVDIYNANTGAFVRSWPVAAAASSLDVHSGIAVYAVGRTVHALRLATGTDVVIASPPRRVVGVEIEQPGVVYASSTPRRGKLVGVVAFLPLRGVIAAVSS